MTNEQSELIGLIRHVRSHHYIEAFVKKQDEAEYQTRLAQECAENAVTLGKIRELLASGVSLDFADINHHTPLQLAVTQNNVELVQLLMAHGADIRAAVGYDTPLHRAAEFGADRVVRFLIEQGLDPRGLSPGGASVLSRARSSRHSREVPALLVELLLPTKSQRPPPPKKAKGLSEEKVVGYLSGDAPPGVNPRSWSKLRSLMDAVYVETHFVTLNEFYAGIEEQSSMNPDLVFAGIGLIRATLAEAPKAKSVKKVAKGSYVHHGDLEVTGKLSVGSMMVTGNLTVKGQVDNFVGAALFVGGDFKCESFVSEGPVIIGGDLEADLVKVRGNDYGLEVRGTLRARKLVVEHKHFVTAARFEVQEREDL
ncbi:ankyrin repeat domain-containing protein [Myxococcus landrumensis]|uniref:Ankyrin repeat domain-containing protein n=1 Tax=Myxococcus landrumensis TaxID=2813577 RepID=A0ABX7NAS7_9BACT|nr:ankyrin repeat domain-containing protein [Myxococcus landrumus]QSQ15866.1 ankyrin repeat domain-containing protein [Myxococcus landrumus]